MAGRSESDAVEHALAAYPHLTVTRRGHTVVARTDLGRGERVVIAGHLDTVPVNDNLPSRRDGDLLHGLGTCDMKSGDAVILAIAASVPEPGPPRPGSAVLPVDRTRILGKIAGNQRPRRDATI